MAKQNKTYVSGRVGNIIFYESQGQHLARVRPDRVKQTKATKASAKDFGRAVRWSKEIRDLLSPLYKDNKLMYRMNTALLKWIRQTGDDKELGARNIQELVSLQLNEEVPPGKRIKFEPLVDMKTAGKIFVTIPALRPAKDFSTPKDTRKIEIALVAVRCNTDTKMSNRSQPIEQSKTTLEIDPKSNLVAEQQLEMALDTIPGDIIILVMGLNYYTGTSKNPFPTRDERWKPGMIVGVGYKG
jgi:hypothetical protein